MIFLPAPIVSDTFKSGIYYLVQTICFVPVDEDVTIISSAGHLTHLFVYNSPVTITLY